MRSTSRTVAAAGLIVGLTVGGTVVPAYAQNTGGDLTPISASRTVDTQAVELQRILASVRAKGRVLKSAAPRIVTAEVPGEVKGTVKRKRLGLPTWRVIVEMESGYKVAAFVHRRTGVIIDWSVLEVPADVEYTPPKKDTQRPDPVKPKPAPIPAIVEQAIEAERQAAAPAVSTPGVAASPSSSDSDDDGRGDSSDDSRDDDSRDDDSRDDSGYSDDGSRDDSSDDSRDDSSDDSRDDDSRDSSTRDYDSSDDSRDDSSDDSRDDD